MEGIGKGDGGVLQGGGHGLIHFSSGPVGGIGLPFLLVVRVCDLNRDRESAVRC